MYKITGHLNVTPNRAREKTMYARFRLALVIKIFLLQVFFDWVEVEEIHSS